MDETFHDHHRLRDGRSIAFARIGDPRGRPLLYFHGFPGSCLEAGLVAETASRLGICIIAPDRPGMGGSDHAPGRSLLDWPDDVLDLAGGLGLDRFPIIGISGGGPYAAACAFRIPECLSAVGLVSSLAPLDVTGVPDGMFAPNRPGLKLARAAPWIIRPVLTVFRAMVRRMPDRFIRHTAGKLTSADRVCLGKPAVGRRMAESVVRSFAGGARGPTRDLKVLIAPWGFALEEVAVPVTLWHGGDDVVVPPPMGQALSRGIPDCRAHWHDGEGHFSLVIGQAESILRTIVP